MTFNLISSPRNVSTAIMYSFYHRGDTEVVDEPFYAYYLAKSGVDHPGRDEILESQSQAFEDVAASFSREPELPHRLVKNMAHHLIGHTCDFMKPMINIFLIRDPKQLIASFAQVIENPTMTDIGIRRQHELFQQLEEWGSRSLVIDSGHLLQDPANYLRGLCGELSLAYTDRMVTWEAGPIPADGVWARYWYKAVHASSGLRPQPTSKRPLPSNCRALYEESLPYYEELSKYALRF